MALPLGALTATATEATRGDGGRRGSGVAPAPSAGSRGGRLDGRRATTHWGAADRFRERFPQVDLDPTVLLLETSDLPVDAIASRCGFGTAASLRLHFQRELRTTPQTYRRTFRCETAEAG